MFGLTHLLYMLISGIIGAGIILALFFLKNDRLNHAAVKFFAIITVIIHYSSLWVEFFSEGSAMVDSVMLLPIYPCNVCMWLLVASAFLLDKKGPVSTIVKDFTFWGGVVCGTIGTVFNENFGANPTLADYDVLKGMLSHSTMIFGCIILFTAGFVKIRVLRAVPAVVCGLLFFLVDGSIINGLYKAFDLGSCNSMYLQEAPFPAMPWLNTLTIGIAAVLVSFSVSAIFELFALKKEDRWYCELKRKLSSIKK